MADEEDDYDLRQQLYTIFLCAWLLFVLVTLSTDGLDTSFYCPERELFLRTLLFTFFYLLLLLRKRKSFERQISKPVPRLVVDEVESNGTLITVAILGKGWRRWTGAKGLNHLLADCPDGNGPKLCVKLSSFPIFLHLLRWFPQSLKNTDARDKTGQRSDINSDWREVCWDCWHGFPINRRCGYVNGELITCEQILPAANNWLDKCFSLSQQRSTYANVFLVSRGDNYENWNS